MSLRTPVNRGVYTPGKRVRGLELSRYGFLTSGVAFDFPTGYCYGSQGGGESLGRMVADAGIHGRIILLDIVTPRRCERVTSEQVAVTFERRVLWGVVSAFVC